MPRALILLGLACSIGAAAVQSTAKGRAAGRPADCDPPFAEAGSPLGRPMAISIL